MHGPVFIFILGCISPSAEQVDINVMIRIECIYPIPVFLARTRILFIPDYTISSRNSDSYPSIPKSMCLLFFVERLTKQFYNLVGRKRYGQKTDCNAYYKSITPFTIDIFMTRQIVPKINQSMDKTEFIDSGQQHQTTNLTDSAGRRS